jgi:hypothetical protein
MCTFDDDDAIADADGLVRYIHPDQIVPDGNTGERRPSSAAFLMSTSDGCLSVDLEELLFASGLPSCHNLPSRQRGSGAVRLIAGLVRKNGLGVFHDPRPESEAEPANPYHGQVFNGENHGVISKGTRRTLVKNSAWLHLPDVDEV